MLYHLLVPLAEDWGALNVFRYLTFRGAGAMITAMALSIIFMPAIIRWLKSVQNGGQPIREDGPESHLLTKQGTPTMGGLMILLTVFVTTLLWSNLENPYVWVVLLVTLGFGFLGFVDDFIKLKGRSAAGVSGKMKLFVQAIISLVAYYYIAKLSHPDMQHMLTIPFFKDVLIDLGIAYYIFAMIVLVGASNAVNLTDGLDGLAIVPVMIAVICFSLIAYLSGNVRFSDYLQIHHVPGIGEVAIICAATVGAGLGFLWYNAPPAQVFMGDTGSLALGGMLGSISVITKHEFVLGIVGGLFVIEALSVIIQVYTYKLTGKRVFLMAPIHHHFEKKGWSEPTIVIRFWIIAVVFALIGLATLKLR